MNRYATMTLHHTWPHPFSTLEHSLGVYSAFFERVYETVLAVVIMIFAIALVTGWGLNPFFPPEISSITYSGEINGDLYGSGEIPMQFGW